MSLYTPEKPCRCGYDGTGTHRCHAGRPDPNGTGEDGSRWCTSPAVDRFVASRHPYSLAGMQVKVTGNICHYCDAHHKEAGTISGEAKP